MEKKILTTFFMIVAIGIVTTGLLSLSLFRIAIPIELTSQIDSKLLIYSAISIFFGILVSVGLGFRYIKRITEPIKQLAKVTKRISTGNYEQRIHADSEGEIQELYQSFNIMSDKLEDAILELQDNNTKMKSILTSMLNGVIALDTENKVILVNPVAEEMFEINSDDIKGKHILDVIKEGNLPELLKNLISQNKAMNSEIEINFPELRTLSLKSNLIRVENDPSKIIGVVIILQDITEVRKLENMRKDFVANVSHELKTPLTSIKGFVETLQSSASLDLNTRERFLNIIEIETDRLTYLIQDLLILSEIENKNKIIEEEEIDVLENMNQITNVLEQLARKKNIKMKINVKENIPYIYGNNSWFKQMLINLIDNAIKYTPEDGDVLVSVGNDSKNMYINVSDTGIGIDKEHIERLFERFYRIDKSRTREIGGTGLGLAIVKHIVRSFYGKINIESQIDEGTKFNIVLPLDKNIEKNKN